MRWRLMSSEYGVYAFRKSSLQRMFKGWAQLQPQKLSDKFHKVAVGMN